MMTDPIADMLTRIRNANSIERPATEMPATKLKVAVAQVLKDEGFILDYQVGRYAAAAEGPGKEFVTGASLQEAKVVLRVYLKYGPEGERIIRNISRSSRPGRRYYQGAKQIRKVLDGLGIAILSTSKGVMSDRQARKQNVGGEVLCKVW
jgi:small subunit ribosomal protein S8